MKKNSMVFLFITIAIISMILSMLPAFALMEGAAVIPETIPLRDRSNLKNWGFFYTGGQYVQSEADKGNIMQGQMYVEVFEPVSVTKPYPIVFLHGNYQTGLNWMGTPDGRDGWMDYFLNQGYILYVADMPTRGRASYPVDKELKTRNVTADRALTSFAGVGNDAQTQWPTEGVLENDAFQQFYATQNVSLASNALMQELSANATVELLDLIGPAILITHSQSGPYGWLVADARPALVKGIVALEPSGPTFKAGTSDYGITCLPMTFDPPVESVEDFVTAEYTPEDTSKNSGLLQAEPARQLVNLKDIPIAIITSSGSYHVAYDYLVSMFLTQAGVKNDMIYLEDKGIIGNGHMMMLELNNLDIAAVAEEWISSNVK